MKKNVRVTKDDLRQALARRHHNSRTHVVKLEEPRVASDMDHLDMCALMVVLVILGAFAIGVERAMHLNAEVTYTIGATTIGQPLAQFIRSYL